MQAFAVFLSTQLSDTTQMPEQRAQRRAAVADRQLTLRRRLAERAAKRRIVEQRVVAESMRPARLLQDPTLHRAAKRPEQAPTIHQRNHANESRGTAAHAAHSLQQQPVV